MPYISVARPDTPRPAAARFLCGPQFHKPTQWADVSRKYNNMLLYICFLSRARHQKGLDSGHFLWRFREVNALGVLALILEPLFLA